MVAKLIPTNFPKYLNKQLIYHPHHLQKEQLIKKNRKKAQISVIPITPKRTINHNNNSLHFLANC